MSSGHKAEGFGGGLNVKKKSQTTPGFDLSKDGDAISWDFRKPVEEQTWGCKLNPALDMLSFEICINYLNGDIDYAIGCINVKLWGKNNYGSH